MPGEVAPRPAVEAPRYRVWYRGAVLDGAPTVDATVVLRLSSEATRLIRREDIVERYDTPSGPYVVVTGSSVDRIVSQCWSARWHGEPVSVESSVDPETGLVRVEYGRDPVFARRWGMDGDQYSGWHGTVPLAELTDVHLDEHELPRR